MEQQLFNKEKVITTITDIKPNTNDMIDSSYVKIPNAIPVTTGTMTAMVYSFDPNRALDTIIYTTLGALTSVLVTYAVKKIFKIK